MRPLLLVLVLVPPALLLCCGGGDGRPTTAQVDTSRLPACPCDPQELSKDDQDAAPEPGTCPCALSDIPRECYRFPDDAGLRCADDDLVRAVVTCPSGTEVSITDSVPAQVSCQLSFSRAPPTR